MRPTDWTSRNQTSAHAITFKLGTPHNDRTPLTTKFPSRRMARRVDDRPDRDAVGGFIRCAHTIRHIRTLIFGTESERPLARIDPGGAARTHTRRLDRDERIRADAHQRRAPRRRGDNGFPHDLCAPLQRMGRGGPRRRRGRACGGGVRGHSRYRTTGSRAVRVGRVRCCRDECSCSHSSRGAHVRIC